MRKHSLKKISEGNTTSTVMSTIGRPKSRGKLNSLTKKDRTSIIGSDLINIKTTLKQ